MVQKQLQLKHISYSQLQFQAIFLYRLQERSKFVNWLFLLNQHYIKFDLEIIFQTKRNATIILKYKPALSI